MRVLVLGLGQYAKGSGISAALFFARQGAEVLVTDQKTEADLAANVKRLKKFKNVRFRLGGHRLADVRWADIIIRNPRVRPDSPEMKLASKLGKRIESDISLFMERCPAPIIGVTGTRGKSTTSTLIAEMLRRSPPYEGGAGEVWLGGNILVSPLTFLSKVKKNDVVVLELSSWQLETTGALGLSPHIAVITNLMRDHLNTYEGMEDYAEAKAQIFRHQGPGDLLIVNADDAYGKRFAKEAPGRCVTFSKRSSPIKRTDLQLPGEHLFLNASAAVLAAQAAGATKLGIHQALLSFRGLKDRQEIVAVKRGVTYINDTTATTPDGTIAALKTFTPRFKTVHLIIGGADKELEFDELAKTIKRTKADVVVLPGTAHAKLTKSLRASRSMFQDAKDLKEAVSILRSKARRGDAIILSPGCASFGQFKNEFDRGARFCALAKA